MQGTGLIGRQLWDVTNERVSDTKNRIRPSLKGPEGQLSGLRRKVTCPSSVKNINLTPQANPGHMRGVGYAPREARANQMGELKKGC